MVVVTKAMTLAAKMVVEDVVGVPTSTPRRMVLCQIYYKTNHDASSWWHRFDHNYQPKESIKMVVVVSSGYTMDPNWYVNIGEIDHITHDLERMEIKEQYTDGDHV